MTGRFIDRFSDASGHYRSARPTYPTSLFRGLAALAPARDLAWDCGTGNGQAAVALSAHFASVHATDPSPQQIEQASPADGVTYRVERAEDPTLPDASADLVLAAQALHWFDLDLFYDQVRRVLRPGGILAAVGYDWMYVDPSIDEAINRDLMPPLAPYWAPQNRLLWDGYRSIPFPGDEVRLGAFAIYLEWSFGEMRDYVMSWSAARALVADGGGEAVASALSLIAPLWGDGPRRVVMPLHLRVSRMARP